VVPNHNWQRAAGGIAWLAGTLLAIAAVWQLRYSFSIEPQARRFQGTGLYRLARHPIYLGYLLEYLGILIISPTVQLAAAVLMWSTMCRLRIHYEEKVLRATFPEYQTYSREVGMLWPRFHPARAAALAHAVPLQNAMAEVIER
jgi:protein-S-isoprenylcysteine O-methyltransferase Ste14